jgi:hypothetical protein
MRNACLLLALAACATTPSPAPSAADAHAEALPFIEDDLPRALALAKTRHQPVFVDVWAPW